MALANLLVKSGDLHSIIIGTIQTRNHNNEHKWIEFLQMIEEIELLYQKPIILHIDVNVKQDNPHYLITK